MGGRTTDILNVFNTTECVFWYGQHRKVDFSKKLKMKWLIGSLRVDSEKGMDRDNHRTQLWYCRKANLFSRKLFQFLKAVIKSLLPVL